jgi:presenilin-like A22 family membrane protease
MDQDNKFKVSIIHLLPIVFSLMLSSILSYMVLFLNPEIPELTFFPETVNGAALNALTFIILMALAATFMYFLIKFGFQKTVKKLIKIALILSISLIVYWYCETILALTSLPHLLMIVSVLTAFLSYLIFFSRGAAQVSATVVIASLIGVFLGVSIPYFTAITLLLALSIYDVISVYKGPIGKIVEKAKLEEFTGAVFTYKNLTVGVGDIVFYSMLISNVIANLGFYPYIGAAAGILIGAYAALKMLEKREVFPGLPLALVLGLVLAIAFAILI